MNANICSIYTDQVPGRLNTFESSRILIDQLILYRWNLNKGNTLSKSRFSVCASSTILIDQLILYRWNPNKGNTVSKSRFAVCAFLVCTY
jgi:hypothetical protein